MSWPDLFRPSRLGRQKVARLSGSPGIGGRGDSVLRTNMRGHDSGPPMPPEFYFVLTLVLKMAVTAGFVLAATITAERAGPFVGGMISTLPIGAGPVYVILALDHDAHFIAQGAVA